MRSPGRGVKALNKVLYVKALRPEVQPAFFFLTIIQQYMVNNPILFI